MKNVIIGIVILFSSYCLHGQSTQSLSFGPLYSQFSGINAEFSYSKLISNKIGVVGRLAFNHKSYGLRAGLFYKVLEYKAIGFYLGAEYNYDRSKFLSQELVSTNIDIPFTINYSLSNKFSLYSSISSSRNLNNSESSRLIDNLRIGVHYKW